MTGTISNTLGVNSSAGVSSKLSCQNNQFWTSFSILVSKCMPVSKEVKAVMKEAFRQYPNDAKRALSYISSKLEEMKIPQIVRNRLLRDISSNRPVA